MSKVVEVVVDKRRIVLAYEVEGDQSQSMVIEDDADHQGFSIVLRPDTDTFINDEGETTIPESKLREFVAALDAAADKVRR